MLQEQITLQTQLVDQVLVSDYDGMMESNKAAGIRLAKHNLMAYIEIPVAFGVYLVRVGLLHKLILLH